MVDVHDIALQHAFTIHGFVTAKRFDSISRKVKKIRKGTAPPHGAIRARWCGPYRPLSASEPAANRILDFSTAVTRVR